MGFKLGLGQIFETPLRLGELSAHSEVARWAGLKIGVFSLLFVFTSLEPMKRQSFEILKLLKKYKCHSYTSMIPSISKDDSSSWLSHGGSRALLFIQQRRAGCVPTLCAQHLIQRVVLWLLLFPALLDLSG